MLRPVFIFLLLSVLCAPPSQALDPQRTHTHEHEHESDEDYDDTELRPEGLDIFECVEELRATSTPEELPKILEALAVEYPEINVISPVQNQACLLSGRRFGCYQHPILERPRQHNGLDLTAPAGTRLVTPMDDCVVANRITSQGYGKQVFVKCGAYTFHYSHLLRWESKVKPGTKLKKGTVVGYVGSTGLSSGPHLHLEVRHNGTRINPETLFEPEILCKQRKRLQTQVACVAPAPKKAVKGKKQ